MLTCCKRHANEFNDESRMTRILQQQRGFKHTNTDSTITIRVQQRHRLELHNDENHTTRIRPQHGFDNDDADSTTTIRVQQKDVGRLVFTQWREIWDRLEGGKLRFWWYVANSFRSFLSADHPPRTPSVNPPRVPKSRLQPTLNTLSVPTRALQLIEDAYPPSTTRAA